MTAPDPLTAHTSAAQQRILTASTSICVCGHMHPGGQPCRLTGCSCAHFHQPQPASIQTPRILTAAEKGDATPTERIGEIRAGIRQIRDSGACSIADKRLVIAMLDLADVVEQLAGQMGGAS